MSITQKHSRSMRHPRSTLVLLAGLLAMLVLAAPASADFGITSFGGSATDPDGARVTQAGAHPDVTTKIRFNTTLGLTSFSGASDAVLPEGNLKDLVVDLPPGLIGNPLSMPACSPADLAGDPVYAAHCPTETQIGKVEIKNTQGQSGEPLDGSGSALYNIVTSPGAPAMFGFNYGNAITLIVPEVVADLSTPGGYRVIARVSDASESIALIGTTVTLWGVPADPVHDARRFAPFPVLTLGHPAGVPRVPLMTLPTACSGQALTTKLRAASWQHPDVWQSAEFNTDFDGFPLVVDGCSRLKFTPSVVMAPSTTAPDAPTGLDVDVKSPQNLGDPGGLANAQLKDVTVTMPDGWTINPGSADGLQACSDDQLGLGNDQAAACPDGSKLGSVSASTPVLSESLDGSVYLRSQNSQDPESGEMFRIALVIRNDERGILVKLPGSVTADKDTGRLTASFKNNPQFPVDRIQLHLKSGPRAPLATPATCGSKTIDTELVSWAGHDVQQPNTFTIACTQGLGGFSPSFAAGTVRPVGGAFSPFALSISKPDGNADLNGLSMVLPTGLLARLKGNLNTQVGTVKAFAGPGSNPFMLPGKVFLEGRYDDAPFSLRVVVPAKAGPFDLGEVTVRQKIYVDPIDAHVTVVSDPVPTIVKGVPARLQRLEVAVDKPDFIINPTSCAAKTISGTLSAVGGQTAAVTNRFQVGDCASLDLKPDLALALSGKGQTTDGKHPAITANLTQKPGQANLKKVKVTLPLSMALDPDNANGLCEFVDGSKAEPTCPKASIVGTATATTPILDEPLSGPVYFVKNIRKDAKTGREIRTLPKLVIPLTGQNGVKLTLTGTSNVENDQLVTTFDNIPDAPVSGFKLDIIGGKGGILTVSGADICKATQIADQQIDGQNNKSADSDVYIQTPSCPLKVLSKKVTKTSVAIKVGGLSAGKVTITGKGIKKTTKTITKSTVATITARRTKGKPGKVTVSFDPTGPAKARKTTK
jgi:hypothetical protein